MSTSSVRQPLENTTNSQSTSPTIRSISPALHRKHDIDNLHARLDSSEVKPSLHSSLYDASIQEEAEMRTLELDEANIEDWPESTALELNAPTWEHVVAGDDGKVVPASFLQPTSPQHTPHRLDPIKEQSSVITLRSRRSGASTLKPYSRSHSPASLPLHKRSFSTTNLPETLFERGHRSSSSSEIPLPIDVPQPNLPVHLPPERAPTPPDLPTFGSPEALRYRLPAPKPKGFRDRMRIMTPAEEMWHRQTAGLPSGVVMRGDNGTLVHGRFRPIRSGQLPNPRPRRWHGLNEQARPRSTGARTEQTEERYGFVQKLARFCCPFAGHSEDQEIVQIRQGREMQAAGDGMNAR